MALNFGAPQGDFLPFLKYNAKAGRFYKKEGDQEVEVQNPAFAVDFGAIKTGWFHYVEGLAPSIVYDESLATPAAKPSDNHKRGFKVTIYSKNIFDGIGEFSSASMHTCNAINDVYTAYEQQAAANAGKVPVVACKTVVPMKDKMGTNYKPVFTIEKWIDRPAEFDAKHDAQKSAQPVVAQAAAVSEF